MEKYTTVVYVISDEVLRILKVVDDPQSKMSNAEIITFVIVTAKFFSGNYKMARYLCKRIGLFSNILSNSRLNRRIHSIAWEYWNAIFRFISLIAKNEGPNYFAVDSFDLEDVLKDEGIHLLAKRGSKAKNRTRLPSEEREISSKRQIIETAFSSIANLFPRFFKTRTEAGFFIKVFSFILAYSASFLWQGTLT